MALTPSTPARRARPARTGHTGAPGGFTLIETLVVVTILAILLGVLLPSLGAARRSARLVACAGNLRSTGQLIQAYAEDNEGGIPRGPRAPELATTRLWIGTPFADSTGNPWPAQFEGLGLLTRKPGGDANHFLFCPADPVYVPHEQGLAMGAPQEMAYGSYLYRQLEGVGEFARNNGRIDQLGSLEFTEGGLLVRRHRIAVQALAVDRNYYGRAPVAAAISAELSTNHDNLTCNVLYLDGAVLVFPNEPQSIPPELAPPAETVAQRSIPWAGVPAGHIAAGAKTRHHMLRILVAADFSRFRKPWLAPVPKAPPTPFAAPF